MYAGTGQPSSNKKSKTQELKAVEEGLLLVVDKELQLDLEMQEVIALCSELEKIKLEHDRENQLLKEEVSKLAKDKKTLEENRREKQVVVGEKQIDCKESQR